MKLNKLESSHDKHSKRKMEDETNLHCVGDNEIPNEKH